MADHKEIVARYTAASAADDYDTMASFRHPNWSMVWPQSGEIVTSHENYVVTRTQRPEGAPPHITPLGGGGGGDFWWGEAAIDYADGSRWLVAGIYEFEGDKIIRERIYFCQPFEAPAWRAQWVEHGTPALG